MSGILSLATQSVNAHISANTVTAAALRVLSDPTDLIRTMTLEVPAGFVLSAERLTETAELQVRALQRRGFLPPLIVVYESAGPGQMVRACDLVASCGGVITDLERLDQVLHARLRCSRAACSEYLLGKLVTPCRTSTKFIETLATTPEATISPLHEFQSIVRVSRRTLYNRLEAAGLPSPERCQYLFRLFPAVDVLRNGATADDAAVLARMADGTTLRRALPRRLGLSIANVRATRDWRCVTQAWLAHTS